MTDNFGGRDKKYMPNFDSETFPLKTERDNIKQGSVEIDRQNGADRTDSASCPMACFGTSSVETWSCVRESRYASRTHRFSTAT
jgi:hypothetical protein